MKTLSLCFAFVCLAAGLTAAGQTVTFSPQGAAALKAQTGKTIKGFQLVSVLACADDAEVVSGGSLYAAAGDAGFSWIEPEAARAVILRSSSFTWSHMIPNAVQDGSLGVSALVASGVIAAPIAVLQALLSAHGIFEIVSSRFQNNAADPSGVLGRLIALDSPIALAAGQCHRGLIGAVYPNPKPAKTITLDKPVYDQQLAARIVDAHVRALEAFQAVGHGPLPPPEGGCPDSDPYCGIN